MSIAGCLSRQVRTEATTPSDDCSGLAAVLFQSEIVSVRGRAIAGIQPLDVVECFGVGFLLRSVMRAPAGLKNFDAVLGGLIAYYEGSATSEPQTL